MRSLLIVAALFCCAPVYALSYTIEKDSDLVGEMQSYTVVKNDTFAEIARKFDLGILELQEANPKIDRNKKLAVGTTLIIPTYFILPSAPREGIVLNVAELRVYYYPANSDQVYTYPVGIGQMGWKTPVGKTTIVQKRANPVWIPPPSIHAEAARNGRSLPAYVPAGPKNPLGLYALNFGWTNYRMHGTNAPGSVGLRSSHGCIRMLPEDIDSLFHQVEVGTKVNVIHEPFKVGVKDGNMYLEAHQPFPEEYYNKSEEDDAVLAEVVSVGLTDEDYDDDNEVNWSEARKLIKDTYGYPVMITNID